MSIYRLLNNIRDTVKQSLSRMESNGTVSSHSVDVIPDDLKINVVMVKTVPIKAIRCKVIIKRENTDNV